MKTKNSRLEFQKELKREARDSAREAWSRLAKGRDYLMQVEPNNLTVEDCLEAFGYNRNGIGDVE